MSLISRHHAHGGSLALWHTPGAPALGARGSPMTPRAHLFDSSRGRAWLLPASIARGRGEERDTMALREGT